MSSPSRSPIRAFSTEQVINNAVSAGKLYMDVTFPGSGHCSSPGSGYNSGHNSMGGDLSGQLFLQQSRGSPEYSPAPSPRMTSPGPSSRVHSGAVTPILLGREVYPLSRRQAGLMRSKLTACLYLRFQFPMLPFLIPIQQQHLPLFQEVLEGLIIQQVQAPVGKRGSFWVGVLLVMCMLVLTGTFTYIDF